MSATAVAPPELDDDIFSADAYNLNVPTLDGRRATKLHIRFSGSGELDRTSEDDLAVLAGLRLGVAVRLIVTGMIDAKSFKLGGVSDEEMTYACTVRVESVEAGEIA